MPSDAPSTLHLIRTEVEGLIRRAGALAIEARRELKVELKQDGSLVTAADRRVERWLREHLTEILPGSTVWGEEEGYQAPGPSGLWILDPIDGTTNFRYGAPQWGISIGLMQGDQMRLGALFLPDLDKLFCAVDGEGALLNGQPLPVATSGPIQPYELISYSDQALLDYGRRLPGKMRYVGAFVAEAACVFEGIYRGMLSDKPALYDAAASLVIGRELGYDVRYADGTALVEAELLGGGRIQKPLVIFPPESGFVLD